MGTSDRALDQSRLDFGNGINQANVGRDMDHLQFRGRKHHRTFGRAGQMGEYLGVARKDVAAGVQRLLIQGGRTDRIDLSGLGELNSASDVLVSSVSTDW